MADARPPEPVIFFSSVISRHASVRQWGMDRLSKRFGVPLVVTEPQPFESGGYYTSTMGPQLLKTMVAFQNPVDPVGLADWKLWTNGLEDEFSEDRSACSDADAILESRPLNLDPGYVTQAKLLLATTKDRDHRIYLREGVFAEVTLSYTRRQWVSHRWTYPDYCTKMVLDFAETCRQGLRRHLLESNQRRTPPTNDP